MDHRRFPALVHHLPRSKDRRQMLGQLLGSFAVMGLVLRPRKADARKRRTKRRKKRPGPRPSTPGPFTCARACGSICAVCVTRAADSLVCGEGTVTACDRTCNSDFDCVGTGFRHCITTIEEMETGRVSPACESPGGHCSNIQACEV